MSGLYPPTKTARFTVVSGNFRKAFITYFVGIFTLLFLVQPVSAQEKRKSSGNDNKIQVEQPKITVQDKIFLKTKSQNPELTNEQIKAKIQDKVVDEVRQVSRTEKEAIVKAAEEKEKKLSGEEAAKLQAKKIQDQAEEERFNVLQQQQQISNNYQNILKQGSQVSLQAAPVQFIIVPNPNGSFNYRIMDGAREIMNRNAGTDRTNAEKQAILAVKSYLKNPGISALQIQEETQRIFNTQYPVTSARGQQSPLADITYSNNAGGTIASATATIANPYPSLINVSGLAVGSTVKSVTIGGMNHTFPDDLDIVLQSPTGVNVILMSDAGGSVDLVNVNYTFEDAAAASLQDGALSPSGTYKPTNFGTGDNWPAPGPLTAPSSVTLSTFGNGDHNGDWKLFVYDDAGGDGGTWASWSITFSEPPPVCFPITITSHPSNISICPGANGSFSVSATPFGVSYNWQVNTGSGFVYLADGGVYSGTNTATLNITGATSGMNGYRYRCIVTCVDGGLPEISNEATLTVLPAPTTGPTVTPTSATICSGESVLLTIPGGGTTSFSNTASITIPSSGPGTPYPSNITVSGLPAGATVKSVTINGINHTWPDDVDILVQSPSGTNVILMSDAGGTGDLINMNYTFDDAAPATLADATVLPSGTYKPTNFLTPDDFPAPGPGSINQPTPTIASFGSGDHNGTWKLFVVDDLGGDLGNISGGWTITFTLPMSTASFSPLAGLYTDATLTTPYTGGQVQQVYAAPTSTTVYAATSVLGSCPSPPTNITITVNPTPIAPIIDPVAANICGGDVVALNVVGGSTATFTYSGSTITIPSSGPATPYPATIDVSGLPHYGVAVKSVTINGISHTWAADVDILVQSPAGNNVVLVSDVGGVSAFNNNTYTFDDAAASTMTGSPPASGTWRPTNAGATDTYPAPGPGSVTQATPTIASLGTGNHNGSWKLFVVDDASFDMGTINSWSITFTVTAPSTAVFAPVTGLFTDPGATVPYTGTEESVVYASPTSTTTYTATSTIGSCTSQLRSTTITVFAPTSITTHPVNSSVCEGSNRTFNVVAAGGNLTYQWQVNDGGGFVDLTNAAPYSGVTTSTLTITGATASLNGYQYRCVVTGQCAPGTETSNAATLTVDPLPTVAVGPSDICGPATLTATGANTYTWSPAAGLNTTTGATVIANPTTNTLYTVTGTDATTGCSNTATANVIFTPVAPTVTPPSLTICSDATTAVPLAITSSMFPPATAMASSGSITVNIPDASAAGATHSLNISGIPAGANVTNVSVNFNINHTWDEDLVINLKAPNGNVLNLVNSRGGSGDNFTNTTVSSTASTSFASGTPPFSGTFMADAVNGVGPTGSVSNVTNWNSLLSTLNGNWTLAMRDLFGGDLGVLTSWSISISYNTGADAGVWSPLSGLFEDAGATIPYTGNPMNTVYAKPGSTTTYSVTVTNSSPGAGGDVTLNGSALTINSSGNASPYPSVITATGLSNASVKSVTINNFSHSWAGDVDIVLVSPSGTPVILMSDVGDGGGGTTGQVRTYTFSDAGGGNLADATPLSPSGTYLPTNYVSDPDNFPAPGPGLLNQPLTPTLSSFGLGDQNGNWNLFVTDDFAGDAGSIGSWNITFNIPAGIVNCTSPPRTVLVTVHEPVVFTQHPQNITACVNDNVNFIVTATGTVQTYQWQVSTNGGGTWTNIANATSSTLTLNSVSSSMSGYQYRCVLSSAGCGSFFSNAATLTVNSLPTVTLSETPSGILALRPGMLSTLSVSSTPAAVSYAWSVNGSLQSGITGSSYVVDAYHLGTYTVEVTDVNGCKNTTNAKTYTALPTDNLFIYPNPTSGAYYITYYTPLVGGQYTISVFDAKGRRIVEKSVVSSAPYTRFDFDASKLAAGVYFVELRDYSGNRLGDGRLVVIR